MLPRAGLDPSCSMSLLPSLMSDGLKITGLLLRCLQLVFSDFIYLVLERGGREGEREEEKHHCVVTRHAPNWGSSPQPRHTP